MNYFPLVISNSKIHLDIHGRYCLNDLHKAAGGDSKYQPSNWLRLDATKELRDLLDRSSNMMSGSSASVSVIMGGNEQGTFVVKELVYAYAMWISPAFHLAVIRSYDNLVQKQVQDNTQRVLAMQAALLKAEPRLNDVLRLSRAGFSITEIARLTLWSQTTVSRNQQRLREYGFDLAVGRGLVGV
jgi:DNA-directed RNA polymerase specialized sigma24 family protein